MKTHPIHLAAFIVMLLLLPSCSKKNAEVDISPYELQTRNIEHLLVCLDQAFLMIPEQANSKQRQANTLVGLLNVTTAQLLIVNDQLRPTSGQEQRQELTEMSTRLYAVHEDLQARLETMQGKAGEQQSDITNRPNNRIQ